MSSVSPPTLILLTVAAFGSLYNAWVNYPKSSEEVPCAIGDVVADLMFAGINSLAIELLWRKKLYLVALMISIVPIVFIIVVTVLLIITRLQQDSQFTVRSLDVPCRPNAIRDGSQTLSEDFGLEGSIENSAIPTLGSRQCQLDRGSTSSFDGSSCAPTATISLQDSKKICDRVSEFANLARMRQLRRLRRGRVPLILD